PSSVYGMLRINPKASLRTLCPLWLKKSRKPQFRKILFSQTKFLNQNQNFNKHLKKQLNYFINLDLPTMKNQQLKYLKFLSSNTKIYPPVKTTLIKSTLAH